jgi:hypothetical protein
MKLIPHATLQDRRTHETLPPRPWAVLREVLTRYKSVTHAAMCEAITDEEYVLIMSRNEQH